MRSATKSSLIMSTSDAPPIYSEWLRVMSPSGEKFGVPRSHCSLFNVLTRTRTQGLNIGHKWLVCHAFAFHDKRMRQPSEDKVALRRRGVKTFALLFCDRACDIRL